MVGDEFSEDEVTKPCLASPRKWTFVVKMKPIGKARAKPRVRMKKKGRAGPAYKIWHQTPQKTVDGEEFIRMIAREAGVQMIHGPVGMRVLALFPTNVSDTKKQKAEKLAGGAWHMQKPDRDNVEKLVMDALSGIAYPDDCRSPHGTVTKRWVDRDLSEGSLTITIWELL